MAEVQAQASSTAVRTFMQRLKTRDTAPELALRRALHRRGVRFRVSRRDLPGRPDIVLVRLRLAIFVDGCFWHGCPRHHVSPKANAAFWRSKIDGNRTRDRRNTAALRKLGWRVVRVWEHDDVQAVAERLAERWRLGVTLGLTRSGARRSSR